MPELPEALRGSIDAKVAAFLTDLAATAELHAGDAVVSLCTFGSLGSGGYQPGVSDIDLFLVLDRDLDEVSVRLVMGEAEAAARSRLVDAGAAGFELIAMSREQAAAPGPPVSYAWAVEMYAADGWRPDRVVTPGQDRTLLVAREVCRRTGHAILGQRPDALFAPASRRALLDSAAAELAWWIEQRNVSRMRSAVLNGCRAWRLAEEGVLCNKPEGGRWAIDRGADASVIAAALSAHRGGGMAGVELGAVVEFLDGCLARVRRATAEG